MKRSPMPPRKSPLSRSGELSSGSGPKRTQMRRSQPKREWGDARRKVENEGVCRHCGNPCDLEAAHIIGRFLDAPKKPGGKVLWVDPDRIVPLCRGSWGGRAGCHTDYDSGNLDLLPSLTDAEKARAFADLGFDAIAYLKRTTGDEYRPVERRAAA